MTQTSQGLTAADRFERMYAALSGTDLDPDAKRQLDDNGYVVLPELMDDDWRQAVCAEFDRILDAEGEEAARVPGTQYKPEPGAPRIAYCVNRGRLFEPSYLNRTVLAAARYVIGGPFKLHGLNARDVRKGQGHQSLHPDSVRPSAQDPFHLINTLWLLDDFTETNGATRLVPRTHKIAGQITDHVSDPQAPHPDQVLVTGTKGTVVIFNGHLWHGGTTNTDGSRRRVIHASYVARSGKQQVDCRNVTLPTVKAALADDARYLLDL